MEAFCALEHTQRNYVAAQAATFLDSVVTGLM